MPLQTEGTASSLSQAGMTEMGLPMKHPGEVICETTPRRAGSNNIRAMAYLPMFLERLYFRPGHGFQAG